jgi:hypothetical protein
MTYFSGLYLLKVFISKKIFTAEIVCIMQYFIEENFSRLTQGHTKIIGLQVEMTKSGEFASLGITYSK